MDTASLAHPAHHWVIDTLPVDGVYRATCKICGVQKDFPEEKPHFVFHLSRGSSMLSITELPDLTVTHVQDSYL